MNIQTKYNIGDKLWFMFNNYPITEEVQSMRIYVLDGSASIDYGFRNHGSIGESRVFKTKASLIKRLMKL